MFRQQQMPYDPRYNTPPIAPIPTGPMGTPIAYGPEPYNWTAAYGQNYEFGSLPPLYPNDEMNQAMGAFGFESPVDMYPADMPTNDVATAIINGLPQEQGTQHGGLLGMLLDSYSKQGKIKGMTKKAAPYVAAAAIHALTTPKPQPKPPDFQFKAGDMMPITGLHQPGRQANQVQVQMAPPQQFGYPQRFGA